MAPAGRDDEAPSWTIPPTQLVTIEYPGYIHASCKALDSALTSLSPRMGPLAGTASARQALEHLSMLLDRGARIVECHLLSQEPDDTDLYRHPILGDIVQSQDLVVRIRRQVWKRSDQDVYRKQYMLELVGSCTHAVRFRRMADFAYRPDPPSGSSEHPAMSLHRALMTFDVHFLRAYRFEPERELYEVSENGTPISNLAMIPPPFFSRQELPFPYGYRQNPTSSLQTVSHASTSKRSRRTARKGESSAEQPADLEDTAVTRYINRARWRNLAPIAIKFSDTGPVPHAPDPSLAAMPLSEKQTMQLQKLREQWSKRPIWSRLALLNQFSEPEARALIQAKELFALVAYTFADGPWRDALVQFGYDPRTDRQSRFYQRIHMRGKTPRRPTTRGLFKSEYGTASDTRRSHIRSAELMRSPTHEFDGKTASFHTSTFQLCDITALSIVPLIHVDGPNQLLLTPDVTTGWYAPQAWEAIRSAISSSFHTLLNASTNDQRPQEDVGSSSEDYSHDEDDDDDDMNT